LIVNGKSTIWVSQFLLKTLFKGSVRLGYALKES